MRALQVIASSALCHMVQSVPLFCKQLVCIAPPPKLVLVRKETERCPPRRYHTQLWDACNVQASKTSRAVLVVLLKLRSTWERLASHHCLLVVRIRTHRTMSRCSRPPVAGLCAKRPPVALRPQHHAGLHARQQQQQQQAPAGFQGRWRGGRVQADAADSDRPPADEVPAAGKAEEPLPPVSTEKEQAQAQQQRPKLWKEMLLSSVRLVRSTLWPLLLTHATADTAVFLLHRISHRATNEGAHTRDPQAELVMLHAAGAVSVNPRVPHHLSPSPSCTLCSGCCPVDGRRPDPGQHRQHVVAVSRSAAGQLPDRCRRQAVEPAAVCVRLVTKLGSRSTTAYKLAS